MKNKTDNSPQQYREQENYCEQLFSKGGPYWHLCTPGEGQSDIFSTDEDLKFGVNNLAYCIISKDIKVLAFSIMSNHIHMIAEGPCSELEDFFRKFRARLSLYLSKRLKMCDLDNFRATILPIENLSYLRNSIAYVNRNAFVVDNKQTPFSYKWSSGVRYWGGIDLDDLYSLPTPKYTQREIKTIFMCGNAKIPTEYRMVNDYVHPLSICDPKCLLYFRDAHHYFGLVNYRNLESMKEIATIIGEHIFVSDHELNTIVYLMCKRDYQVQNPAQLTPQAKIDIARIINNSYNATNRQIQRILRLDEKTVNSLFPLTAKTKGKQHNSE